ncbi:MAG: phosphate signaling complex protein PhoU [Betaproteobacteria bacterium]
MSENGHFSRQFDEELERLRTQVLQMGGMVEAQIRSAGEAYSDDDIAAVKLVIETDRQINEIEKSIDDDCVHVIAKRQPAAGDLRLIMGVSKIVTDLERTGDEAKKMAKGVRRIHERGQGTMAVNAAEVRHLAEAATVLLRRALDAFARLNCEEATAVIRDDEDLDRQFKSIVRQLVTYMMEDPRTISTSLDIITIARAIERIGDHAKNVAEQVIYIVEGRDIRYPKGTV